MSRALTPKDAHVLMNLLVKQATGQQSITVTDTSSFVSAGETVLATGMENVFNSLNIVLGRTIVAARPYQAKLMLMDAANTGVYTSRMRKISFYSKDALADGDHNTDLFTNLKDGFTAGQNESSGVAQSTKSQWEQIQPIPLEMNFGGSSVWQHGITQYEDQVQAAFRNEGEFLAFVSGYLTEHQNDIESTREAWNRMVLLNKIGQTYDMSANMPGAVIDLVAGFNAKYGTNYSGSDLRTTYLKEFLAYFVAEFKKTSEYLTERSANYHWSPADPTGGSAKLLRHTPYAQQRVYLNSNFFKDAEAQVLPEIFNPQFLDIKKQYEPVSFWQSQSNRDAINVEPAIVDVATGAQAKGSAVNLPFVLGCIADVDALMTDMKLEVARTTPLEARKGFRTTWLSFERNAICDPTENFVLFYMAS